MSDPTISLRAVKEWGRRLGASGIPSAVAQGAALDALVEAVEATVAFTRTPPDWTDAGVQKAYGKLRAALARFSFDTEEGT